MPDDHKEPTEPGSVIALVAEPAGDERPLAGERFGKYQLVRELASGGMAQIFLSVYQGLEGFNRVVAIKRVLPQMTASPEFVQMFLDEARLAARLEHPNIVRTYEFGVEDGRYFMVMEYLAGEDLNAVLNRAAATGHPLPIPFVAQVASRVCAGLHFAHELLDADGRPLGLVHRDVSPGNIVATYFGEVKLIDFGVAKAATNVVRTRTGILKGKISYMSPEQLRSRGVDRRSDVFSIGIVLWELLAGVRLFARDSDAATLYAILDDQIPPVQARRPDVPDELARIVERALARAPEDRWATAEDMQLALDHFVARQSHLDLAATGATAAISDAGARGLARELEQLFGAERTSTKRAIAQGRALAANIAVMGRLQSDLHAGPVGSFSEAVTAQAVESGTPAVEPAAPAPAPAPARRSRVRIIATSAVVAGALGGGLAYLLGRHDAADAVTSGPGPAALTVTSSPAGAAIYLAGEPTGMTTPATLSHIGPGSVTIRLELRGYAPVEAAVAVAPGARVTRDLRLEPRATGRLVVMNLPRGAVLSVDGTEHAAGEAVPVAPGRHTVRVLVDGQPVAQQTIETAGGEQAWELSGHELRPRGQP
jgi:serine/threonine-protein kinase